VRDIRAAIAANVDLPAGYSVVIGGQFENQQRAQARLAIVLPVLFPWFSKERIARLTH
jgi:cobalt-zinc-cadmium resistance protein CzcA